MKETITKMPMKYIGRSLSENYYSIFQYKANGSFTNQTNQNTQWLINACGNFTIPKDYFDAFKVLGSFISGTDNILFKWAEFSVNASKAKLKRDVALSHILTTPTGIREVEEVRRLYNLIKDDNGEIVCVWSNRKIDDIVIDHMIPFSIWKNNDFWNLLPTTQEVNGNKSDKIPSNILLLKQKDIIIYYWELICQKQQEKFLDEMQISLLGKHSKNNWQNTAFNQLLNTSKYLIETRGYEEWKM